MATAHIMKLKSMRFLFGTLALIGAFCLARIIFKVVSFIRYYILLKKENGELKKKYFNGETPTWAVITGATSGIGYEFVHSFARRGFNVLLISRNAAKLATVQKEIQEKYPKIKTDVFAFNFADKYYAESNFEKLEKKLTTIDVGVLVNNVGVMIPNEYFDKTPIAKIEETIDVNDRAAVRICHMVLPQLLAKANTGRKSAIVNVSSIGSAIEFPLLAAYCASKAFITMFTKCLAGEYERKGIDILCVQPGTVITNMSKSVMDPKPDLFTIYPAVHTEKVMDQLASMRRVVTCAYWGHALMVAFARLLPLRFRLKQMVKASEGLKEAAALKNKEKKDKKQ